MKVRKQSLICLVLSFFQPLWAQNIGIGTTAPKEKLHVAGNLRFDGALMPAGNPGTPGQVLVSQGPATPPQWQTLGLTTIYEEVLDPEYLFHNATFYETPTLGPNNSYLDISGGLPTSSRIMRIPLIPPGLYSNTREYIVEIKIVRESIISDNGYYDSDEKYGLTDDINGVAFTLPDCDPNCCKFYEVLHYTPGNSISETILDGISYSSGICQDETSVVIKLRQSSTYIAYLPDAHRAEASGSTSNALNISNGLWFEIYRHHNTENYRIRVIYIRIIMK